MVAHPGFDTAILHIIAAMTAGGTGTILTNPLWVVKTRFMVCLLIVWVSGPRGPRRQNRRS